MTELEQLKKRVEQLEKLQGTQPTEKPTERWKPESHEQYLFVNYRLDISTDLFLGFDSCNLKIRKGNAFPEGMKDYLEREHVKLIQFHNEMANILWQIDSENMGRKGAHAMCLFGDAVTLKMRILFQYSFKTSKTAELAWAMLSDEIKEWLTT